MDIETRDAKLDIEEKTWTERWLSAPRFSPYLAACGNDVDRALALYEWNARLGQVLMGEISYFEVALRNAYDRTMREKWSTNPHWLLDDNSPVRRSIIRTSKRNKQRDVNLVNRRAIAEAQGRAHDPANPDQIIANLTLGFWAHMTDRSRERDLWIPMLHQAWPDGTDRAKLNFQITAVNRLRNRVAHNERLFNPVDADLSPVAVGASATMLFRALCPEAAQHLYGNIDKSPIELFCEKNPAPAKVQL